MAPSAPSVFDESVEILSLLRAVWKRKLLVMCLCLASALLFFVVAVLQERSFMATATVMLDPREQRVVATQDQVVSDLKLNSPILESEVAIIRSYGLLSEAVETVGRDQFDRIVPVKRTPGLWGRILGQGTPIAGSDTGTAHSALPPEDIQMTRIIHALRQGISVRRVGDSYVIEISIRTPYPQLSAATANALAQGYIRRQLEERRRVAESATQWLADQVTARRDELALADTADETYQRAQ